MNYFAATDENFTAHQLAADSDFGATFCTFDFKAGLSNKQGEVTSQNLWSRYDRHFVSITRALSHTAKICRVIQIKLNQLV